MSHMRPLPRRPGATATGITKPISPIDPSNPWNRLTDALSKPAGARLPPVRTCFSAEVDVVELSRLPPPGSRKATRGGTRLPPARTCFSEEVDVVELTRPPPPGGRKGARRGDPVGAAGFPLAPRLRLPTVPEERCAALPSSAPRLRLPPRPPRDLASLGEAPRLGLPGPPGTAAKAKTGRSAVVRRWWSELWQWPVALAALWAREVSVDVPAGVMRDHLALERTFLAYLRTGNALALAGVFGVQVLLIDGKKAMTVGQEPPRGEGGKSGLTFVDLGVPVGVACAGGAMLTVAVGGFRFWRVQRGLVARNVATAGGLEVWAVGILVSLVSIPSGWTWGQLWT